MIEQMVSEIKSLFKGTALKNIVFFIMMPCPWWQQRKIISGRKKRDTKQCGSYLKCIHLPATPSWNATEVVHPVIYFHKEVDCHVRYRHSLHKLDPKILSIATLKKGKSSYLRIFDPEKNLGYELTWRIWVHFTVFDRCRVEIILTPIFIIPSRGIGQWLSDAIRSRFKIFVGVH